MLARETPRALAIFVVLSPLGAAGPGCGELVGVHDGGSATGAALGFPVVSSVRSTFAQVGHGLMGLPARACGA